MICPYCGATVQKDARFCGDCGKPLAVPLTVAMPAAAPVRPSSGRLVPPSPSAARAAVAPGVEDSAATTMRRVVNAGGAPAPGRPATAPRPAVASSLPGAAPATVATPAVSAAAAPAAAPAAAAAAAPAAPAADAAPVRASAFLDAVESPVARVLRIVLLLVLDAGLIGVGTYYLYQFIRLSPAAAAPSITIGQPSLVRGQEAGRPSAPPLAPAVAVAPGAPVEGAAAGEPARPSAGAAARSAKGGKSPATPAGPTFGGARPAAGGRPVPAPAAPAPAAAPSGAAAAARRAPAPAAAPAPAPARARPAPAAARDDDPGEVEAQIDAESVRIIMRQHKGDVRGCYNQGLKSNPDASGTIEVRFAIDAQGRAVKRRVITDTLGLPGVGDCIVGQLGRWQFPRPVGGEVEFVYPFILSPGR